MSSDTAAESVTKNQADKVRRPLSEAFAELATKKAQAENEAAAAAQVARAARKQRLQEALERGLAKALTDRDTVNVSIGVSRGAHGGQAWIDGEYYNEELQVLAEEIAAAEGLTVTPITRYQNYSDSEFQYLVFSRRA